jgi:hypothetical protein
MTTRYRLLGGSIKPSKSGPYIRVADVVKEIEAQWDDECAGYRSNQCEACNTYYRAITTIDPDYKGWDGYTLMKDGKVKEQSQPVVVVKEIFYDGEGVTIFGSGGSGGSHE